MKANQHPGTEAQGAVHHSQGLDKNMLVVWFGLGPVHLHRAFIVKKKKKKRKKMTVVINSEIMSKFYSTKVMHL